MKEILDPEIPPAKFRLDTEAKRVIPPEGIPPVVNPYDEQAVEIALRLKEKYGGRVTAITLGQRGAARIVRHALALGVDEGIILEDKAFEDSDSFSTAYILSQAIRKITDYDLILCGRQAADWDEGLVGSLIAQNLSLPLITLAEEINFVNGEWKVKRAILDGYQVFLAPTPAVVTVSHEAGKARLPSGWGIISASKKQIAVWNAGDIQTDIKRIGSHAARRKLLRLFIPEKERKCEIIEAKTMAEATEKLVTRLKTKCTI